MNRSRHKGFTLIELIIFIVVVSAGLAGILSVLNSVVKSSADPVIHKQGLAIAESLLEEILLKEYGNPPEGYAGTVRAQFDDVDDYVGYTTSVGIVDAMGTTVTSLSGYNISPAVTVALVIASENSALNAIAVKKITVSVAGPGGMNIQLTGYRSNH